MILIPFIYYTFLSFFLWRTHKRLDVCVYMSGLWAISSFIAILLVLFDMYDGCGILWEGFDLKLGMVPTLFYCVLPTMSMFPFMLLYGGEVKKINNMSRFTLFGVSALLIVVSLVNLYVVADSTIDILQGDFVELRNAHYSGEETFADIKAQGMPWIFRFLRYFNFATILALPIGLYYLCFTRCPKWFVILLFGASLTSPVAAIQNADRTEIILFSQMLVFCMLFFFPYMSQAIKRLMWRGVAFFSVFMFVYVGAVSISRFEEQEGGAVASVMKYAGQGYLNFCFFSENAHFERIETARELPILTHLVIGENANPEWRDKRSGEQGFFISVFATYLGDLMLDWSPFGLIIWSIIEMIVGLLVVRYRHRSELNLGEVLVLFVLATVPIFGIFYYRFYTFGIALEAVLALILLIADKYKVVWSKGNEALN